jgi:hypothetical protein
LRICRGGYGVRCTGEGGEAGIALGVDLDPTMVSEGLSEDPPVLGQHLSIVLAQMLQQLSRALDVGEQERDRAAGKILHRRPCR